MLTAWVLAGVGHSRGAGVRQGAASRVAPTASLSCLSAMIVPRQSCTTSVRRWHCCEHRLDCWCAPHAAPRARSAGGRASLGMTRVCVRCRMPALAHTLRHAQQLHQRAHQPQCQHHHSHHQAHIESCRAIWARLNPADNPRRPSRAPRPRRAPSASSPTTAPARSRGPAPLRRPRALPAVDQSMACTTGKRRKEAKA